MIIRLNEGTQLVVSPCTWVPGAYLAAGNLRGSQGVILRHGDELDAAIAELTRIRAELDERAAEQQAKRSAAA